MDSRLWPKRQPDVSPAPALKVVPEVVLHVSSVVIAETSLEAIPEVALEVVSEVMPEVGPEVALEFMPEVLQGSMSTMSDVESTLTSESWADATDALNIPNIVHSCGMSEASPV